MAYMEVREGSGGPHGGAGKARRPTRRSGSVRDILLEVWVGSGGPCGGAGGVGRPTRRCMSGWEAHNEVREGLEVPLEV